MTNYHGRNRHQSGDGEASFEDVIILIPCCDAILSGKRMNSPPLSILPSFTTARSPSLSSVTLDDDNEKLSKGGYDSYARVPTKIRLLLLLLAVSIHLLCIYLFYIPLSDRFSVLPRSLQDVRHLSSSLLNSQTESGDGGGALNIQFLLLFLVVYLFAHAYCIPGATMLNVLCGSLFGTAWGTILTTVLTAVGSTMTYYLTLLIGRKHIVWLMGTTISAKMDSMEDTFKKQTKSEMFLYMIGARMFPMIPGWFLNIVSPLLGIDVSVFFSAALIGNIPMNWLTVKAGSLLLHDMDSMSDLLEPKCVTLLACMSILFLGLPLLQKSERFRKLFKFE